MRVGRPHYGAKNDAPTTLRILERDMRDDPATVTVRDIGGLGACAAGDLEGARRLAARGGWSAAHAIDKHGSTALMWAASYGQLHVCEWLVEEVGAEVNAQNKAGRTALMFASKYGRLEVVSYLLGAGADLSLRMRDDSSAFDWAILGGDVPTMDFLAARVDLRAVNKFGCAAVQWAAAAGNVGTLRWLRRRGVDLGHVNHARHGAVVKAAWKGHDEALRWLLLSDDGPKLTSQLALRDHEGRTVAQLAAMNGMDVTAAWLAPLVDEAEADARAAAGTPPGAQGGVERDP